MLNERDAVLDCVPDALGAASGATDCTWLVSVATLGKVPRSTARVRAEPAAVGGLDTPPVARSDDGASSALGAAAVFWSLPVLRALTAMPTTIAMPAATAPEIARVRCQRRERSVRRDRSTSSAAFVAVARRRAASSSSTGGTSREHVACPGERGPAIRDHRQSREAGPRLGRVQAEIAGGRVEFAVEVRREELVDEVGSQGKRRVGHGLWGFGCSDVVSWFPRRSASAALPREMRERTVPAGMSRTSAISA